MTAIKEARVKLGLSQSQMAKMLNTPIKTYIKWDVGESNPPGVLKSTMFLVEKYKGAKAALLAEYT